MMQKAKFWPISLSTSIYDNEQIDQGLVMPAINLSEIPLYHIIVICCFLALKHLIYAYLFWLSIKKRKQTTLSIGIISCKLESGKRLSSEKEQSKFLKKSRSKEML